MNKSLKLFLLATVLTLCRLGTFAQTTPTAKLLPGYLYPVETTVPNKKIYICGQRPVDLQGQVVAKGDLNAQLTLIFANITTTLGAVGMSAANIRQISYRVTDSGQKANGDNGQIINTLAAQYFGQNKVDLPSISEIKNVPLQVDKDVVIEVEVVAIKE
ncbi:MAG: RidA family protein [Rudanella sp.]|nr:RidA family protein [Rudanella sp.]